MTARVLISGAGIAGPAAALLLDRLGWDVTVVERAPGLRSGGQAVDFRGDMHRSVLAQMGVADEIESRRTGTTDWRLVDRSGRLRGVVPGEFLGGDVEIHRGDLALVLAAPTIDHCDYRFDDSVTTLTQVPGGVRVGFERGAEETFDLVVGADGIHSAVRRLAFGPEERFVRRSGYRYAVAGRYEGRSAGSAVPERTEAMLFSEPGRTVIEGGTKAPTMFVYKGSAPYDSRSPASTAAELRRAFAGMGWRTAEAVERAIGGELFLDEIASVRMSGWVSGRVVLLGDAGYGNTLGGFGTGLALIGAYVLANELAGATSAEEALARYEAVMRPVVRGTSGMHAGAFMAPPSRARIELRHRVWSSARLRSWYIRLAARMADRTPLPDYPAASTRAAMPSSTTPMPNSSSDR
jgi:2-polyprenyl-6-methoxyphenol hydroxylase-like FAD-dependent oxidoreductase